METTDFFRCCIDAMIDLKHPLAVDLAVALVDATQGGDGMLTELAVFIALRLHQLGVGVAAGVGVLDEYAAKCSRMQSYCRHI